MLQKLKNLQASLLRGGFCAVWLFAFIMAFFEFLYAVTVELDSPEQGTFIVRSLVCLGVGVVAAVSHAYLLRETDNDSRNNLLPR